jgi:hypothetical protein
MSKPPTEMRGDTHKRTYRVRREKGIKIERETDMETEGEEERK